MHASNCAEGLHCPSSKPRLDRTGPDRKSYCLNGPPAAQRCSRNVSSGRQRALATEPSARTALVLDPGDGYPEGSPKASTLSVVSGGSRILEGGVL